MWDYGTPLYDIMEGLNNVVKAGKVRYLGISNCYAESQGGKGISRKILIRQYERIHGL